MVDPGFMGNLGSMGTLATMVNLGSMGNLNTVVHPVNMGFKKRPLDVAKSHSNTRDEPTTIVLGLVIQVRGATLMGLITLEHGAIVRN